IDLQLDVDRGALELEYRGVVAIVRRQRIGAEIGGKCGDLVDRGRIRVLARGIEGEPRAGVVIADRERAYLVDTLIAEGDLLAIRRHRRDLPLPLPGGNGEGAGPDPIVIGQLGGRATAIETVATELPLK